MIKNIASILGLNHNGRYNDRAQAAANQVQLQQEQLVTSLRLEVARIDASLQKVTDVGPDTTDSLRPVNHNFDAHSFVRNVQELSVAKRNAKIELDIAIANYREMFDTDVPSGIDVAPAACVSAE